MTTANEEKTSPNVIRASDYRTMYINWVQPSFTPFDVSLVMGHAGNREQPVPTGQPGTVDIEIKAKVSFHPSEAKLVALLLLQSVASYEKQFGKIVDPKGISTPQVDVKAVVGEVVGESTEGV